MSAPLKILVAEDERMMLKALSFRLSKDGHEVTTAENGKEAWELFKKQEFNLLVLDIMMPYLTGLELLQKVKEVQPNTPVIILSTLGQEDTVLKAFELGADDFMTKPFSPNELIVRIKKMTTLKKPN
jgi:two-component system response regulator VicR